MHLLTTAIYNLNLVGKLVWTSLSRISLVNSYCKQTADASTGIVPNCPIRNRKIL